MKTENKNNPLKSWEVIKAVLSNLIIQCISCYFLEPIVEIKANTKISVASWFKGTPIPMICIEREHNEFERLQSQVS